jgi:hypothetical protein
MGPGGYQSGDCWRMGLSLEILVLAAGVPMILVVWPIAAPSCPPQNAARASPVPDPARQTNTPASTMPAAHPASCIHQIT